MVAVNVHGIEAKIYVVGKGQLTEMNAWAMAHAAKYAEVLKAGAVGNYPNRLKGGQDVTGSITVWHDQDSKILQDIAVGTVSYGLLIYPKGGDLTTYYQLTAWFDFNHRSEIGGAQSLECAFFGDGALQMVGFAT